MKRTYNKPIIKVIEIKMEEQILVSSLQTQPSTGTTIEQWDVQEDIERDLTWE